MEPEDEKVTETITGFAIWDASAPGVTHPKPGVMYAAAQYVAKIYALPEDVIESHTVDGATGPLTAKAVQAKLKPWAYFDGTTQPSAWTVEPGAPSSNYCMCFDCFPNHARTMSDTVFEPFLRNFWQAVLADSDYNQMDALKNLDRAGREQFRLHNVTMMPVGIEIRYERRGKKPQTMMLTSQPDVGRDYSTKAKALKRRIPGMAAKVDCPVVAKTFYEMDCNVVNLDIMNLVIHLNDNHRWTREEIADHLDLLELEGIDLTVQDAPERPYIAPPEFEEGDFYFKST